MPDRLKTKITNKRINKYITEIKYDTYAGVRYDTRLQINAYITVAGDTVQEFAEEVKLALDNLFEKYRI